MPVEQAARMELGAIGWFVQSNQRVERGEAVCYTSDVDEAYREAYQELIAE